MTRALRLAAVLTLALPATAPAGYGDTVNATPGLVAYWPLDEPSGATAITDTAGQRTASLFATYGLVAGTDAGGTSVDLAGGAANFGTAVSLPADRTIEAWVAQRSTAGDRYVVSQGTTTTGYHLFLAAGGIPTFQVNATRVTGPALARGTWHHLAATLAGRALALYVDGRLAGSGTLPADPAATTQSFWIGRLSRANAGSWSGGLDEIALYDQALDAATVAAHFAAGIDATPPVSAFVTTPAALTNASSSRFTFMGSKTGVTFSCRLDGGTWALCPGSVAYTGLADGAHTVEVRATDRWGLPEAVPIAFRWAIDATPPRSVLLVAQPTALRPGTAVLGSEPGATFQCRSVNGAWAACPPVFPLPDSGHSYGLYVRAVDLAGNVETGEASVVVARRPTGIPFTGAPAAFAISGPRARSSWSCSLDGASATACPATLAFPDLPYGTHTLQVSDPGVAGVAWPTITWTDALPAPVLAGAQFPALVSLGASRLPRLLFASNAPATAQFAVQRRGLTIRRWTAPVARGANVIRLTRAVYRLLRPGRYVLGIQAANAAGAARPLAVRFDVVRATKR